MVRTLDGRNACPGAEILGLGCTETADNISWGRNACPGAEILGRHVRRSSRRRRRRNACPGAEILGLPWPGPPMWSQCLPRGRNPGTRIHCRFAMPAQGQKSWDALVGFLYGSYPDSQCLPRGRNPGTGRNPWSPRIWCASQCLPRGRNPGTSR